MNLVFLLLQGVALGAIEVSTPQEKHFESFSNATYEEAGVTPYSLVPVLAQKLPPVGGDSAVAENLQYLPSLNLLLVVNDAGGTLDVYEIDTAVPELVLMNQVGLVGGAPQSVAASTIAGVAAVAVDTDGDVGQIAILDLDTIATASAADFSLSALGYLPDHASFSPDSAYLCVAIEAEPDAASTGEDALGGVAVFTSSDWKSEDAYESTFATFRDLDANDDLVGIHLPGVALNSPNTTVSRDLEPEFITYAEDSTYAIVACQENNAFAILDLASKSFTKLYGLGWKSFETYPIDASDEDGIINIVSYANVFGMYQPDVIEAFTYDGTTYFASANEGDAKDYDVFSEEERAEDLALSSSVFPDAATLQLEENLGRFKVTTTEGIESGSPLEGNATYSEIVGFGGRSFSIWNAETGELAWDSGSQFAFISSAEFPANFNAMDGRSDDKASEPEAVELADVDGRKIAFVGTERANEIYIYDITDPFNAIFLSINLVYNCTSGLSYARDPEAIQFVPADDSVFGYDILITVGAFSGSLHIYRVIPTPAQDICEPYSCPDGCTEQDFTVVGPFERRRSLKFGYSTSDCPPGCVASV